MHLCLHVMQLVVISGFIRVWIIQLNIFCFECNVTYSINSAMWRCQHLKIPVHLRNTSSIKSCFKACMEILYTQYMEGIDILSDFHQEVTSQKKQKYHWHGTRTHSEKHSPHLAGRQEKMCLFINSPSPKQRKMWNPQF